jgi:general secretion pathway protein D
MYRTLFQQLFVVIVFFGLTIVPVYGVEETGDLDQPAADGGGQRFITIDFDNVDIRMFIKYISELTGKNFVVDRAVQGNVTIVSPTKISEDEAYRVFESVLNVHGYTTVTSGPIIKILPSAEARSQNIDTKVDGVTADPEDRVVTQLIPLKYTAPEEMKKVLTPLVSKTSVMVAHTPSGILIVTETQSNMQRLLAIIESIDVEFFKEDMAVIPLRHATSEAIAKVVGSIYQQAARKDAAVTTSVKVVPYERINSLVVVASTADIARIRGLVAMLDTPVERGEGNIHVFYLQNASATELIKVLNVLPEGKAAGGKDEANIQMPAISKDVKITADAETNSLIITASKEEYNVIEDVIKKLDIPRRMVYLEALIMEVDTAKSFEVGVQWITGGVFADGTGRLATGFSGNTDPSYNMIGGIDDADPVLPTGFSFGVLKQGIQIGGVTFPNIAAILRAYKNDSAIDIISTPQILTTDNKKAEISVGENIPYITSQNTSSTGSGQDYTQYEYKDVSTKLTITPHINQADTLRLEIQTEVIKLKAGSTGDQFRPTTFKRTADTTVILNDTDTVVIGGIIGQDSTDSEYKVPLLGDIPLLGRLFKHTTKNDNMTNMFIFITPHIIRNPADLSSMSLKKEVEVGREVPQLHDKGKVVVNTDQSMALTEMGFDRLLKGNYPVAKQYFVKALDDDPKNPYALLNLGVVYESEDKPAEALKMYQAVIATGTASIAPASTDPSKKGLPLVQIARDNIEKLQQSRQRRGTPGQSNPSRNGAM